jgi:hypothetical protein
MGRFTNGQSHIVKKSFYSTFVYRGYIPKGKRHTMIYPTEYVQKRKRRRIAAIVSASSAFAIAVFVVISYLGTSVGRYTVELEQNRAFLTISTDENFTKETSLLRAANLDAARAESVDYLPEHDILDDEHGQGSHNGDVYDEDGILLYSTYFAYTFFLKNRGDGAVDYRATLSLTQSKNIIEGAVPIEEYVRVRLYENLVTDEVSHSYRTFAKTTNYAIYDDENNRIDGECIGNGLNAAPYTCSASKVENSARAEVFESSSDIVDYTYLHLDPNVAIRYTIVIWLEGDDPDCTFLPPTGASLEFGMTISALVGS